MGTIYDLGSIRAADVIPGMMVRHKGISDWPNNQGMSTFVYVVQAVEISDHGGVRIRQVGGGPILEIPHDTKVNVLQSRGAL